MNGIIVVDKPQDFTSFDVVAKLRGICQTKKIGHGGTLDPMATGVLPVFVGRAVKAVDLQPRQDKEYEAVLQFGLRTDTGDITGQVLETGPSAVEEMALNQALASFLGTRQQLPPLYSAVKVAGKPLYKYAREGKEVARKAREVTFFRLENRGPAGPGQWRILVHCSKGTYIRSLAEELGQALGCPATLAALRRTAAGQFTLQKAHSLASIQAARDEGRLESLLLPVEDVFLELPALPVDAVGEKRLLHGAALYGVRGTPGLCRLQAPGGFLGLGRLEADGSLKAEKLFVERDGSCS